MHNIDERVEEIARLNDEAMLPVGFEEALIGWVKLTSDSPVVALYATDVCIEILMDDDMTDEEAIEFFEYNVLGSYLGDGTPAFVPIDFEEAGHFYIVRADGEYTPEVIRLFDEEWDDVRTN